MESNPRRHRFTVVQKRPAPLEYSRKREERKMALPEDFAEKVLEIETWIDRGEFTQDDISELMLLYSQAVEYYNSINNNKASYYTERIQMALMKPKVMEKMEMASSDPEKMEVQNKNVLTKRTMEKNMDKKEKSQKKSQEYIIKREETVLKKVFQVENVIKEVHEVEDTNVD
jgi:hypothetical protein